MEQRPTVLAAGQRHKDPVIALYQAEVAHRLTGKPPDPAL
jgi:hypothetical protein